MQKFYGLDKSTGDICRIYFFENQEAPAAFRYTEQIKTIPDDYEAKEVWKEVYEVFFRLYPKCGSLKQ